MLAMSAKRRAVSSSLALVVCLAAPDARADVAVVLHAPEDAEVKRQLAGLIDEPVTERPEAQPRSLPEIVREAAAGWPERYVVVVDREGDSVHVLRPSDQTSVSRLLTDDVLLDSHYAVALATAELLEWLGATPRARASVEPSPPPQVADASLEPEERVEQPPALLGFVAGASFELSASPGFDPSLSRIALEGGVELGRARFSPWGLLGVRLSALGSSDRTLAPETAEAPSRVDYESTDFALQAGLGIGAGPAVMVVPVVGVSLAQVSVQDQAGRTLGQKDRVSGFLGLGLAVRYPIAWGLSLSLAAEGQWLPKPARYRVEGREALEEGPLRAQTRIGIAWESGL